MLEKKINTMVISSLTTHTSGLLAQLHLPPNGAAEVGL